MVKLKRILLLLIFPLIMIISIIMLVKSLNSSTQFNPFEAEGASGLIYADYFTGNSARYEWQFAYSDHSGKPELKDNAMLFSGAGIADFAMFQYTLPSKCDIYFTLEVARRGEGDNRNPAVFLNMGEKYSKRYLLYFEEGKLTLSYNDTITVAQAELDNLKVNQANYFRLSIDENVLQVYMDGSEEAVLTFRGKGDYADFTTARNFGIYGCCNELWFDNFVVTNGKDLLPITEVQIQGNGGRTKIEGIDTQLQMEAYINPTNSTDRALFWSVDNKDIAEITQDGLLTAKDYGIVVVTACARDGSNIKATCEIEVTAVKGQAKYDELNANARPWNLANDFSVVFESDDPAYLYPMSPCVTSLDSGRIVVTFDINGDAMNTRIPLGYDEVQDWGRLHTIVAYSDDDGETWDYAMECDLFFSRTFVAGGKLYLIGSRHAGSYWPLMIAVSEDEGETWSEFYELDDRTWHSAPSSVIYKGDYVYLTMEVGSKVALAAGRASNNALSPILLRAKVSDDLTKKESWTFSSELSFYEVLPDATTSELNYTGIMNYATRESGMGWYEGNVIQMHDTSSPLYDPTMNTFYIYLRGMTRRAGYAAIMKVTENEDGTMTPSVVETEAGNKQLFVAMPGGHDKFNLIYDEESQLYWLASNYNDESMILQNSTTGDQQSNTYLSRYKLALYFSKDSMNWNFAGIVAEGDSKREARGYPYMNICGDDILVVTRCGDEDSSSLHDNNMISFHRISNFRDLVY